jgi:type I restriction enzyme R subunit
MIVCMSRRICVAMHDAMVALRPAWHADEDDERGAIKVVMTGSAADDLDVAEHIRSEGPPRAPGEALPRRQGPAALVIVRDMWLTGFDAPSMHTLYVDKPMQGHGLMQAIARVNRVFGDKPGGLVVDYLGYGECLRRALSNYTDNGGKGETAVDQNEAVAVMLEKLEIAATSSTASLPQVPHRQPLERVLLLAPRPVNFVLRSRKTAAIARRGRGRARAGLRPVRSPATRPRSVRDEVAFFQTVKAMVVKSSVTTGGGAQARRRDRDPPAGVQGADRRGRHRCVRGRWPQEARHQRAVRGLPRRGAWRMPHKNLAAELLRKLLNDELKTGAEERGPGRGVLRQARADHRPLP